MPTDLGEALEEQEQVLEENEEVENEETEEADGPEPGEDSEEEEHAEADPEVSRQEIQERLLEQDKALEDSRITLKQDWEDLEAAHEQIKTSFANPVPLNGKPAFLATDEEFEAAEDSVLEMPDSDTRKPSFIAAIKQARVERREYQKRAQALTPQFNKVYAERSKRTMEDVGVIKDALKEISPEYEKHFNEIENLLHEEFKANPVKLERFMWGGIRDKYRFIDRLLETSGLKGRVEKIENAKTRPNLTAPVGVGKGKRSTPTGTSSKREFTRKEIDAMSLDEYNRLEPEIEKALMEGRIK